MRITSQDLCSGCMHLKVKAPFPRGEQEHEADCAVGWPGKVFASANVIADCERFKPHPPIPDALPCPFCGSLPKAEERPAGGTNDTTWAYVCCDVCEARPHVSASRQVWQWVGNDKPNEQYVTEADALRKTRSDAMRQWNRRTNKDAQ